MPLCTQVDDRYIRKIKSKEIKAAGNIYCPYCKPDKVAAVWRISGWFDLSRHVACDKHKNKLIEPDCDETAGIY